MINLYFRTSFIIFLIYSVYSYTAFAESKNPNPFCFLKTNKPNCELFSETIEGPFYIYYPHLIRQNIREKKSGSKLQLKFKIVNVKNCKPLKNLRVDLWQADGFGNYSSYENYDQSIPPGLDLNPKKPSKSNPKAPSKTYLRGTQFTNRQGIVKFNTIVPGWYPGRTAHIHIEIYDKKNLKHKHKGQFYFSDSFISQLQRTRKPYSLNRAKRITNSIDCTYLCSNGMLTTLNLKKTKNRRFKAFMSLGLRIMRNGKTNKLYDNDNGQFSKEVNLYSSTAASGIKCKKTGKGKSELYKCKRSEDNDKSYRKFLE